MRLPITFSFILLSVLTGCSKNDEVMIQPKTFPEIVNGTVEHQSRERKYVLHIPSSYDGTKETPLVIFLHGGGGNSQNAQGFTNFNQSSKTHGFLMAYPQAAFEASPNSFVWGRRKRFGT
jgi:polyhydroxybutyrate depolymerase